MVSALHYAYSNENKRFTRLGVVAAIPAVKEFGKGKVKRQPIWLHIVNIAS